MFVPSRIRTASIVVAVCLTLLLGWLRAGATPTGVRLSVARLPGTSLAMPQVGHGDQQRSREARRARVPRHLVHHNFRKPTPTSWCSHHRLRCVDELNKRFHEFLARHPHRRTHWGSAANRRAWHHRYIRAWRAKYAGTGCTICRASAQPRRLAEDWSRYSRGVRLGQACDIGWERTTAPSQYPDDPFYSFECQRIVSNRDELGGATKTGIVCEAMALTITGVGMASVPFSSGVTTPLVMWGLAGETSACGVAVAFKHFLNWP